MTQKDQQMLREKINWIIDCYTVPNDACAQSTVVDELLSMTLALLAPVEERVAELEPLFREAREHSSHVAYLRVAKERDALRQWVEEARRLFEAYQTNRSRPVHMPLDNLRAFFARPLSGARKEE